MRKRTLALSIFLTVFLFQGCTFWPPQNSGADVTDLIEQVSPALVQIRSTNPEGVFIMALAQKMGIEIPKEFYPLIKVAMGSGFIVDPSGIVVTNHHVIHPGWLTEVILADGRTFLTDAIGSYERDDIAAIALQNVMEDLPYVKWAKKPAKKGDDIFMLGRRSVFDFAYKTGVVSHPARLQFNGSYEFQTPMPVIPGESGSAAFNMEGRVVAVVSSYYVKIRGVSACIPGPIAETLVGNITHAIRKAQRKMAREK